MGKSIVFHSFRQDPYAPYNMLDRRPSQARNVDESAPIGSGQISSRPKTRVFTPNHGLVREIPENFREIWVGEIL